MTVSCCSRVLCRIVIAFVQGDVLRILLRWLETFNHERLDGLLQDLRVLHVGFADVRIQRTAVFLNDDAPLVSQASSTAYLTDQTYEPRDGYRYPLYYNPAASRSLYNTVAR